MLEKMKQNKIKKLKEDIEYSKLHAISDFRFTDIFYGLGISLFSMSILMWIPVIGWILLLPVGFITLFNGKSYRQKFHLKNVEKLERKLKLIN